MIDTPETQAREILADPRVQSRVQLCRDLCSRGETELELAWADRICSSSAPSAELADFPYHHNYRQLAQLEIGVLAALSRNRPSRSVAFLGSGPLPLSALHIGGRLDLTVEGIDNDPEAVSRSHRVADTIGAVGFRCNHSDATDVDLTGHDVVVLAAMVGATTTEKTAILERLRDSMDPGALLLARSARGLRTLLYPPIELDTLDGFEIHSVIHPGNDIINSVILARVPSHRRDRNIHPAREK